MAVVNRDREKEHECRVLSLITITRNNSEYVREQPPTTAHL